MSQKPKKFEIFISYRRKGGYNTAKLLYDRLRIDGYSVFFDIDALEKGDFDSELEQRVYDCKDFLLVLNPGVFDRFFDPECDPKDDWLRQEIVLALEKNKNIVPLILDGFIYPNNLPEDVKNITKKNAIDLNPRYFENAYELMKQKFLLSKPNWAKRNKKLIISFFFTLLLALVACVCFLLFNIYEQNKPKDLQLQMEPTKKTDSIKSIKPAAQPQPASQQKSASSKAVVETPPEKPPVKSIHWAGTSDIVGQVIYEKLESVGMEKTKCSDNGIVMRLNKPICETDDSEKVICTYSPKITITDCNGKVMAAMATSENFKTSPQANENAAKEELANELREVDFDDWVSELKKLLN